LPATLTEEKEANNIPIGLGLAGGSLLRWRLGRRA
jgi:hypothetical protein